MNRQLSLVGALLRKDTQLFWQFAALNGALIAVLQFPDFVERLGPLGGIMQVSVPVAMTLFVLLVLFEDTVVSVEHDWLVRPIPGTTLLIAKSVFVVLAILVPSVLAGIAHDLYEGRSLGEAMLAGVSLSAQRGLLMLIIVLMVFAALTNGIRQAGIVFLVSIVVMALLSRLVIGTLRGLDGVAASGSSWVLGSVALVLTVVAVVVIGLQYRQRHTRLPWVIAGVAVSASVIFLGSMTWPRIFGVQKLFSEDPGAASGVRVEQASGCFPARVLGAPLDVAAEGYAAAITLEAYSEEQRKRMPRDAIAFVTQLVRRAVPEGQRLIVGPAVITYRTPGGAQHTLYAGQSRWTKAENVPAAIHYWLLARGDYERLAAISAVEAHIDYSLSLLAPAATAELVADGRRAFYEGIGYCSAAFDRETGFVHVDCFKAGVQPAQLEGILDGRPAVESQVSGNPDFTPAALSFLRGRRYKMHLRATGGDAPRVRLTALEARAHFDRQIVVPGVLGGPVSACPAPKE